MIKIYDKTKKHTIFLFAVLIGSMLLLQGCVQSGGTVSPAEETVLESINKRNQIESYKAQGSLELTISTPKGEMENQGTVNFYTSGENKRTDVNINLANQTAETRLYNLANETYSCTKKGNWTCEKAEKGAVGSMGTVKDQKLKEMIKKGEITFASEEVQEKEVNGRECNYVVMNVDPEALLDTGTQLQGQLDSLEIGQCLDKETGIALQSQTDMEVSIGQSASMTINMKLDSLETGVEVSEEKFTLPG